MKRLLENSLLLQLTSVMILVFVNTVKNLALIPSLGRDL